MNKNKESIIDEALNEASTYGGGGGFGGGGSAFGGSKGGGSGSFSYGSRTGAKTVARKSPPFRGTTAGVPTPSELAGIIQDEEEERHMAPPQRPYPLETINDALGTAYLALGNAEAQMKTCAKYNAAINQLKDKKKLLEFLTDKIGNIKAMIDGVAREMDRINLSNG